MEKLVDSSNVFDPEAIATSIDDLHPLGFNKNVSFSSFSSNSSGSTIIGSDNSLNNDDFYGGKRTDSIIVVERRKNGCDNSLSKEVSDGDFDGAEGSNSIIVVAGSKNGSENRLSREISDCDFDGGKKNDSVVVIEGSENGCDNSLSWKINNCNFGGGRRGDSSIVVEETKNGVDFIDCVESERSSLSSLSCSNSIQAIEASFDPEAIATAINDLHQLRFKKNVSFGNCTSSSNSSSSSTVTGSGNSLSRKFDNGDSDGGKMDDSVIAVSKHVVDFIDCVESEKSSTDEGNEASFRSICPSKPHKGNNIQWDTIQCLRAKDGEMGLAHFRLLKKLGCGDIGSVYLAELRGMVGCLFAMKVMDKGMLAEKKKLLRAQTEREILGLLDHPFLPTLYSHFETDKFSCLLMEFCSGGDLHMLRQRQQGKHFSEQAARFYASEVLLALEYLHVMGVVYRDLKPENVLVREDGHIMLSDFDLSLRCYVNPTLIQSSIEPSSCRISCNLPHCVEPPCLQPSCFRPGLLTLKPTKTRSQRTSLTGLDWFPVLVAEPTTARSMSFVGTHEYLAPEIIKGDGHGSAVDWWTFGIFLYELLHGRTPFKGKGNRETLFNVVGQSLKFPEGSSISVAARDLIRGLLAKDPKKRLGFKRGATEIKRHPFFESVSWALIRSIDPPAMPKPFDLEFHKHTFGLNTGSNHSSGPYLDFEFF